MSYRDAFREWAEGGQKAHWFLVALTVFAGAMACGGDSATGNEGDNGSVVLVSLTFKNILNTAGNYNLTFEGVVKNDGSKSVKDVAARL